MKWKARRCECGCQPYLIHKALLYVLKGKCEAWGVGDYYGPLDAYYVFDKIADDALITQPLKND
ncbi:sulfate adenylyltransferase [Alcanivorax sp. NBRC 101098]|nr:sulfate adenylyltransferase [Alcanivorax sp. NBRC 101098]